MNTALKEFAEDRRAFKDIAEKTGLFKGIKSLIIKLFPLESLFVYELIQNAEDSGATMVLFELYRDSLVFKHNGSRDFTENDIRSITSIFDNLEKINRKDAIGKFGIGFKSVYMYTDTPEIHSGKYHFQIEHYFIPVDITDKTTFRFGKDEWTTVFVFKFDRGDDKMSKKEAFEKILHSLRDIDYRTVLFLKHMQKISYTVHNKFRDVEEFAHVRKTVLNDNFLRISTSRSSGEEKKEYWLKYSKPYAYRSRHGALREHPVEIAFKANVCRSNVDKLLPVNDEGHDKLFTFFPCSKEPTGLKFLIHGPFSTTLDRTALLDVPDPRVNDDILAALSMLIVSSLEDIKSMGLLNVDFLSIMPNNNDYIPHRFRIIRDAVLDAFRSRQLLPTLDRKHVDSEHAWITQLGFADLYKLFDDAAMKMLFGEDRKWLARANLNSGREESFYTSLDIRKVTQHDFISAFDESHRGKLEKLLKDKWSKRQDEKSGIAFLGAFYNLLHDSLINASDAVKTMVKQCKVFLTDNEKHPLCLGYEIYLPEFGSYLTHTQKRVDGAYYVHPELLMLDKRIERLFKDLLLIPQYGADTAIRVAIERILNKTPHELDRFQLPPDQYFSDLLKIAKYYNDGDNSRASLPYRSALFYGENRHNGTYARMDASSILLSRPYIVDAGWDIVCNIYDKPLLADFYSEKYSDRDFEYIREFFECTGGIYQLKITESDVANNPNYKKALQVKGPAKNLQSKDYYIDKLKELLAKNSPHVSKLVWRVLESCGNDGNEYETAWLRKGLYSERRTCDSRLFLVLKGTKWVPCKDGRLRKPADVSIEMLCSDLKFTMGNRLLSALKIGYAHEKEVIMRKQLEEEAEAQGCCLISKEDYDKYIAPLTSPDIDEPIIITPPSEDKRFRESIQDVPDKPDPGNVRIITQSVKCPEVSEAKLKAIIREEARNSVIRRTFTRTRQSTSKEEKQNLLNWYGGHCQICGAEILQVRKRDPEKARFFVACNICFAPDGWEHGQELSWNTLCLCPNCNAKYKYSAKKMVDFLDYILNSSVPDVSVAKDIKVPLSLAGDDTCTVTFKPDHFHRVRTVFKMLFDEAEISISNGQIE